MLKKSFIIGVLAVILTGCQTQTASITDLIHEETDKVAITEEELQKADYEEFMAGEVLFLPYTRHIGSSGEGDEKYMVMLSAYQPIDSDAAVVINTITVYGSEDVTFEKIHNEELSIPLDFYNDEDYPGVLRSNIVLMDQLNERSMNLKEDSVVTMVLNVSVTSGGETITQDITFEFDVNIREYIVQR
ncbi:hypothetical protein JOC95_000365 [Bacillus tianshenii]|uniref:Lipoprotein n=1 Tax=Sutcliffiella tianshenii TaxID=1463404 RepID=A0ABS2NVS0_9BACI|nr:hypothetical protein [Bacillus tianshenii]MBM7618523.1 hypothetical protein [Bacillus tianshenii]